MVAVAEGLGATVRAWPAAGAPDISQALTNVLVGVARMVGFVSGTPPWGGMTAMPWKSLGVLELTALPTIGAERWVSWVREADALLVDGGDATYLGHWMRESGLADLLPSLSETVWVGVSAGSMVMTPRIGADFVEWQSAPDDGTLGIVDFSIFPHLDVFPENTLAKAERWAADMGGPAYAIDDQTAIKVTSSTVEVVSEGVEAVPLIAARPTAIGVKIDCRLFLDDERRRLHASPRPA